MGVSGLVVAQHLCRRAASFQIPFAHGHGAGSNSCTSCEQKAWGPYETWPRRPSPRPRRLKANQRHPAHAAGSGLTPVIRKPLDESGATPSTPSFVPDANPK